MNAAIRAVDGLTARWSGAAEGKSVSSAAGVRPLPALPADGTAGPAREEPAEALGMPAGQAGRAAGELPASPAASPTSRGNPPRAL
ncbi:hypothetical protein ACIBBD_15455 [Streptomyces sp. NPDC051315]|uniref:hypothetical protein n=1 Tax=Streptomyces sp. NPDC051315 TaxID=3365650 RepID=UPI0037A35F0C